LLSDRVAGEELSAEPLQYADFCEWENELLETQDAETGKGSGGSRTFLPVQDAFTFEIQPLTEVKIRA